MFSTVFGASSSNISKTIGPWFVVIVIWDMAPSPLLNRPRTGSSASLRPCTVVPLTASTIRSASAAGTSTSAKRSSTLTLRIASPSSAAAGGDRGDQLAGLEPAARPVLAISLV